MVFARSPETEEQKAILERLDYELSVINTMGFPAYFFDCGRFCAVGEISKHSRGSLVVEVLLVLSFRMR